MMSSLVSDFPEGIRDLIGKRVSAHGDYLWSCHMVGILATSDDKLGERVYIIEDDGDELAVYSTDIIEVIE